MPFLESTRSAVLRCATRDCSGTLPLHSRAAACPDCGELLEVALPRPALDGTALSRRWRERRTSDEAIDGSGVWRFRELLPTQSAEYVVTMGEGNVPLLEAPRCAAHAGLGRLAVLHLGWNPTGSFKDLGMTVGVSQAVALGATEVACASTGNTSASLAAYAARAGVTCSVYLPRGGVAPAKITQATAFGARIVEVDGNFDHALQLMLQQADDTTYVLNSINPFRVEGQKTAVLALLEQRGWRVPDVIALPGGNLGNVSAFGKALRELRELPLIGSLPRLLVVQAEGASPFVRCWRGGGDTLDVEPAPATAASAIRIGAPRSWRKAVRALRETDGDAVSVSEREIWDAQRAVAHDGIGAEAASAAALAGVRKAVQRGDIDSTADVVVVLTGHALKSEPSSH